MNTYIINVAAFMRDAEKCTQVFKYHNSLSTIYQIWIYEYVMLYTYTVQCTTLSLSYTYIKLNKFSSLDKSPHPWFLITSCQLFFLKHFLLIIQSILASYKHLFHFLLDLSWLIQRCTMYLCFCDTISYWIV